MNVKLIFFVLAVVFAAPGLAYAAGVGASTTIWMSSSSDIARGGVLIRDGKVGLGMTVTKQAMATDLEFRDRAAGYTNMCAGYLAMKLYNEAIISCDTALRLHKTQWQAYNNRAAAHFGLANFDAAIDDFNRALRLRPTMSTLRYNLALTEHRKRQGGRAQIREWDG